jgi:hypothetical protein
MMRSWNGFHPVRSSQKIRKLNNLEVFGSDKIKGQKQVSQDQLRSSMPKISFSDLNLLKWIYYLFRKR